MGELIDLNPRKTLTDADIPAAIARDTETAAAVAAHAAAVDPHPVYLTQIEGDGRYWQSATALADADIPAAIARDAETAAAIAGHVAVSDPHPSLWTRITNAFLALTGGQAIIKNNPGVSSASYSAGQNHLQFRTSDGSNPILGFHRAGFTATALYHLGYGNNSLRIRNADGFDGAILHDGNIGDKIAGSAKASLTDDSTFLLKNRILRGTIRSDGGTGNQISLGTILQENVVGLTAMVAVSSTIRMLPGNTTSPGCYFDCVTASNAIQITTTSNNSANLVGKSFAILVTYLG